MKAQGFGALGFLVAGLSCGPDASNDPTLRTSHACLPGVCLEAASPPADTGSGLDNAPLEDWPDSNAEPLSGVFAAQAVVGANVAGYAVTLRLLFRLRILLTSTSTKESTTLCAFKLPSVPNLATLVIPPLLQTVIQRNSVAVAEGDYLSTSGTYKPPPFLLVLGAKLQNAMTDPLPSMADMTGEWDEDQDGHPGVTVDATVFTCGKTAQGLYVALRTGGTLLGSVTGPETIDGTMDLFETESVLGYSNSCLSAAAEINPTLQPNSQFHAQRLADESQLHTSGNVTCSDIVAKAPALFGSAWMN